MDNSRKTFIRLFLLIYIICGLVYTVFALENETINSPQQGFEITTIQDSNFSELSQKNDADNIIEAQRNLDRSLDILNTVASLLGVLIGLLTLIIAIVGGLGFFEIRKWTEARKNIEKDVDVVRKIRNNAEKELDILRKEIEKNPLPSLLKKPSEELKKNLDEFNSRLEILEILGGKLSFEDHFNRANDYYYKSKYEYALKAIEKAIELKPDYAPAWVNKSIALTELGRNKEAIKANEKAIELKPDYPAAWTNKGITLCKLGQYDEAFNAIKKAYELKPDDGNVLYNFACLYSIKGETREAISYLTKAIEKDTYFKEMAKEDKDFENIREDKDFKKLIE